MGVLQQFCMCVCMTAAAVRDPFDHITQRALQKRTIEEGPKAGWHSFLYDSLTDVFKYPVRRSVVSAPRALACALLLCRSPHGCQRVSWNRYLMIGNLCNNLRKGTFDYLLLYQISEKILDSSRFFFRPSSRDPLRNCFKDTPKLSRDSFIDIPRDSILPGFLQKILPGFSPGIPSWIIFMIPSMILPEISSFRDFSCIL